jgi:hypothetical protein
MKLYSNYEMTTDPGRRLRGRKERQQMRKRTKPADGSEGAEVGNSAASLTRGLEILRAFTADDATLGNQDLIERTGLPKATVSRLTYDIG